MHAHKLSISLPEPLYEFVESYREEHHCSNRSEVIGRALHMLQQAQLEKCYRSANEEIDDVFEVTAADGLSQDEAW